jgi:preprotein translocase subunit SecA
MIADLATIIPVDTKKVIEHFKKKDFESMSEYLNKTVEEHFKEKEKKITKEVWLDIVRVTFLQIIDQYWTEHLTAIEDLREGINLRGYAQIDPLVAYKNEAFGMFEKLLNDIYFEALRRTFRIQLEIAEEVREQKKEEKPKAVEYKSASAIDPFAHTPQETQQIAVQPEPQISGQAQSEPLGGDFGIKLTPPGGPQKPKLGRNDPCWCGSGKKYKKCHYPN